MSASETEKPFPWIGLLTLAGAIFVSVTSEFLPTGLLPEMAEGLGVSQSQVGLLVAVFAGTVVLSTAPLAAATQRFDRKSLIAIVLVVFAIANFSGALAPSYEVMVASRVLAGLAHGLFWAIVGAYAGHLVPRHHLARAVAVTSAGATTAFVLGLPAGTALGHALGWRPAFIVVGVAILILTVLMLKFLPPVQHRVPLSTGEIALPGGRDPSVLGVVFVCAITTLFMVGHNLFYTFIVPFFVEENGFPEDAVSGLLLLYGAAGAIGLIAVGTIGGRFPRLGLIGGVALIAVGVSAFAVFPTVGVVIIAALIVWGAALGGVPALLQTRLLHVASRRIRDVAAAWFTISFNVGIGGGALIGSLLLEGYGLGVLPFVDVAVTVCAVILIIVSDQVLRNRAARLPSA